MKNLLRRLYLLAFLASVVLLCGCGKKNLKKKDLVQVKGKITLQGEPAKFVLVEFQPEGDNGAEATGRTDGNGEFELRTYSNSENDGATPGTYKVSIEPYNPVKMGAIPQGESATKFKGTLTAPDTVEVGSDGGDLGTIDIPGG